MNRISRKLFITLMFMLPLCVMLAAGNELKTALIVSPSLKADGKSKLKEKFEKLFNISPEMIDTNTSENLKNLASFNVVFSNKEIISKEEFEILYNYVENGGYLVAAGDFGKWLDINKNNTIDEKTDKAYPEEALKLTGTSIQASRTSIEKIRNLSCNPLLRNFDVDRWMDYPVCSPSVSSLKTEEGTVPVAEALYRPSGYKNPGQKQNYFSSRSCSRYDAYICAKAIGKGMTVRIAENLFTAPLENPFFKALVNNLLEISSYSEFLSRIDSFRDTKIIYEHESLTPNSDFNDVYLCAVKEPVHGNIATGEFMMPSDWQFNSWKGKYLAKAERLKSKYGEFALMASSDDPDSRCGGSIWSVYCNNSTLETGVRYKISLYAKGENITSGAFDIKVQDISGKVHKFRSSMPAGTFDWKDFECAFTIPKSVSLKKGFIAGFSFTGPGKLYVTHYVLKEEN